MPATRTASRGIFVYLVHCFTTTTQGKRHKTRPAKKHSQPKKQTRKRYFTGRRSKIFYRVPVAIAGRCIEFVPRDPFSSTIYREASARAGSIVWIYYRIPDNVVNVYRLYRPTCIRYYATYLFFYRRRVEKAVIRKKPFPLPSAV